MVDLTTPAFERGAPRADRPSPGPVRRLRAVAVLMALVATSLVAMAELHLSGLLGAHARPPFTAHGAGAGEAVIAAVLAVAVVALVRAGPNARRAGLAATGFAIAGFALGLAFTISSDVLPDIVYHATVLPLLLGGFAIVLRTPRTTQGW